MSRHWGLLGPLVSRASSCIQASASALGNAVLCKGWMLKGWRGRWGMLGNMERLRKAGSPGVLVP